MIKENFDIIFCPYCEYCKIRIEGDKSYYICKKTYRGPVTKDDYCSRGKRRIK